MSPLTRIWVLPISSLLVIIGALIVGCSSEVNTIILKECVENKIGDKKYRKTPAHPTFAMHYGENSVEVFHVMSQLDMKRIEFLQACVREQDSSYFWNRHEDVNRWTYYGGANVTYITGVLQEVLPEIESKIYSALTLAIKDAEWKHLHPSKLGIRSLEYLSCTGEQPRITKGQVERERLARKLKEEEAKGSLYIGPRSPDLVAAVDRFAEQNHDEVVASYLNSVPHTVITAHLSMSDVDTYQGGEIAIERTSHKQTSTVEEDVYEPEDEEIEDESTLLIADPASTSTSTTTEALPQTKTHLKGALTKGNKNSGGGEEATPETPSKPKRTYSAVESKIEKFAPEKGGFIFALGSAMQGMKPVTKGHRMGLRIEFWAYAHAPLTAHIATIESAKPLLEKEL